MFTRKKCDLYVTHHLDIPQLLPWSEIRSSKKWHKVLFFAYWKRVNRPIYAVFSRQKIGLWVTFLKIWFHFMVAIVVFLGGVWYTNHTFCMWTYFFNRPIYFGRLRHVNPLCKYKKAFLEMKEASNQKIQEKKSS